MNFTLIHDPFFSTVATLVAFFFTLVLVLSIALVLYNLQAVAKEAQSRAERSKLREQFLCYLGEAISWDEVETACLKHRHLVLGILLQFTDEIDEAHLEKLILLIHKSPSLNTIFLEQVNKLSSPDWQERRRAASLLPFTAPIDHIGNDLIKALSDEVFSVRISAANSLAKGKMTSAVLPILTELLADNYWPRGRLVEILTHFGENVEKPLIQLLNQKILTTEAAVVAISVLALQKGKDSHQCIAQYLSDPNLEVRLACIRVLANQPSDELIQRLIQLLEDPDWEIRSAVASAIGKSHKLIAIPHLVKSLSDANWWVRFNAAHALLALDKAGLQALTLAQTSSDMFAQDVSRMCLEGGRVQQVSANAPPT
jgi:hypothetical protein